MNNYTMYALDNYINVKSLVSAFEAIRECDFVFSGEVHNFWEMVYVMDGKIGVTSDDRVFILEQGEIIFHKPMEFHRLWSEGGNSAKIMIFSFDADGKGMELLENGLFKVKYKEEELLKKVLEQTTAVFGGKDIFLANSFENPDLRKIQLIKLYLEEFMLSVINRNKTKEVQKYSVTSMNYNVVINKMKENLYQSLTVDEIAKMSNLSVSNLKKIFKIYTGEGVMRYFNRMKIHEAAELLKSSLSIGEISDMLSFSCQNYFTVAFKREMGISPIEYRKRL